jgi:hypothetical protein
MPSSSTSSFRADWYAASASAGQNQEAVLALAQRLGGDERLQLGNCLGVRAESDIDLDPRLERLKAQLAEACALARGEAFVARIRKGLAAPEPKRLPKALVRLVVPSGGE